MTDHVDKARRSAIMRAVRSRDTGPERSVRKLLHALGYRFRLHRKDLPGKPDIVFPGRRKVIFVHGCFWHRHKGCRWTTTPKSNVAFWTEKFEANVRRDRKNARDLRRAGWGVMVIWQCQAADTEKLARRLRRFLDETQ